VDQLFTRTYTNQTISWLVCSDSSQPELGGSHHLPPYSNLCDESNGLHPNVIFPRTPKLGGSKFLKLGLPERWRPITSCIDFRFKWSFKQNYSLHWEIFNDMRHATYMHIIQGDSRLLMVRNQIDTLTLDLFFGHNLC
jgi:hypothetical protein